MRYDRLDACCGNREWWRGKNKSRVVFVDKLIEVKPSIVADFTVLPFKDDCFEEIWFDPPHLIRNDLKHWTNKSEALKKFGNWPTRRSWESALDAVNVEFSRVASSACRLIVKIIDGKDRRVTKRSDLSRLTRWTGTFSDRRSGMGWSSNRTVWGIFSKL